MIGALLVIAVAIGVLSQDTPTCDAAGAVVRTSDAARVGWIQCVRADLQDGRWQDADTRLRSARGVVARLRGRGRVEWLADITRLEAVRRVDTGRWEGMIAATLPDEATLPWVGPLMRGVAAARASWAQQDAALQAKARGELAALEALALQAGPVSEAERARLVVQGAMAGAQYERDEMQLLLDAAHELEQRLYAADDPRSPVILALEVEADFLRLTDRYVAARERYRDLLTARPRRVQARIGMAQACRRLGETPQADELMAQARALWAAADAEAQSLLK